MKVRAVCALSVGNIPDCRSCCPTGTRACCRTSKRGSGHVWLYQLGIFPTHPRRALGAAARGNTRGIFSRVSTTVSLLGGVYHQNTSYNKWPGFPGRMPLYIKIPYFDLVGNPIKSHFHTSRSLFLNVVGDTCGCNVVAVHECWRLLFYLVEFHLKVRVSLSL